MFYFLHSYICALEFICTHLSYPRLDCEHRAGFAHFSFLCGAACTGEVLSGCQVNEPR